MFTTILLIALIVLFLVLIASVLFSAFFIYSKIDDAQAETHRQYRELSRCMGHALELSAGPPSEAEVTKI